MKQKFLAGIMFPLVLLVTCKDAPIHSSCRPVLPELPVHWKEILGEPYWRLEWIGEGGIWLEWEGAPGQKPPGLSLVQEWSTPVLAWPFWPSRELLPGMMRPAGALFPWDFTAVDGEETLRLGWKAGVDAVFWKEMALAERLSAAAEARLPWYFDWPRFRELLADGNIPEAVRKDPWLADWKDIAQKTIRSGFDRRRIVSKTFTALAIPGLGGRWTGSSPFAPPLDAPAGGPLCLNATGPPDTWVSSAGVLRCSASGWVFRPGK